MKKMLLFVTLSTAFGFMAACSPKPNDDETTKGTEALEYSILSNTTETTDVISNNPKSSPEQENPEITSDMLKEFNEAISELTNNKYKGIIHSAEAVDRSLCDYFTVEIIDTSIPSEDNDKQTFADDIQNTVQTIAIDVFFDGDADTPITIDQRFVSAGGRFAITDQNDPSKVLVE